jgi:DNA-binding transcriptional regulator GbsR (MarR family)
MSPLDNPIVRRFIEDAGNTTQALGVGRVIGQIFAYLYFSEEPRGLDDMKEALGISKGSASMGVRQLEQWGAVQRVWIKGDRKDYYTANDYFGQIVRNIATDLMGKRLASLSQSLDAAEAQLTPLDNQQPATDNPDFLKGRVARLREFQEKINRTWNNPIVKLMLK